MFFNESVNNLILLASNLGDKSANNCSSVSNVPSSCAEFSSPLPFSQS